MSAPNDERRPGEGRRNVKQTGEVNKKSTARVGNSRRPAPTYALATVFLTRTTRGGLSVVAVVECPFDRGHLHLHRASLDFISGRRRAGCGAGSYIVHVGALESGVAA